MSTIIQKFIKTQGSLTSREHRKLLGISRSQYAHLARYYRRPSEVGRK